MSYRIKELFYSLQGEGFHSGRPAVFCRFSGCNLTCEFCDTDFQGIDGPGGGVFETPDRLASAILNLKPEANPNSRKTLLVLTGGEPLLQLDEKLLQVLHAKGFEIAVETNGTVLAPEGIDWLTVSPKKGGELLQKSGNELKLLFPERDLHPQQYEMLDFEHFFLLPVDVGDSVRNRMNVEAAVRYCLENPTWRLSLQIHKIIGIR